MIPAWSFTGSVFGHGADGGEAARGRGAGAGGDRLLVLAPRLAQVGVQVDEAGADHEARDVDDRGSAGGEARRPPPRLPPPPSSTSRVVVDPLRRDRRRGRP